MVELRIKCESKEVKDLVAENIHKGLVGYEEYINNNILLNKDEEDCISLLIGPNNGSDVCIQISGEVFDVMYQTGFMALDYLNGNMIHVKSDKVNTEKDSIAENDVVIDENNSRCYLTKD